MDREDGTEFSGRYFNMRGAAIDEWTADLDQLFVDPPGRTSSTSGTGRVTTIGIGDGGNEIGMGRMSPDERALLRSLNVALPFTCDVSTDWNVVAGTSDWGAFALATATLLLNNRLDHLKSWNIARMESILAQLVEQGPAVDGCTRRPQVTVDGLPLATWLQPWMSIRRACGWPD